MILFYCNLSNYVTFNGRLSPRVYGIFISSLKWCQYHCYCQLQVCSLLNEMCVTVELTRLPPLVPHRQWGRRRKARLPLRSSTFMSPTEQLFLWTVLTFSLSLSLSVRDEHFIGDLQLKHSYLIWFWFLYSSNHSSTNFLEGVQIQKSCGTSFENNS